MIHFIVATIKEARPLIDFYKLKKNNNSCEFQIFQNNNISLTVSKIGKVSSALSVSHTFFELGKKKNQIWINFGLAGIKNMDIGKLFLVNKIIDFDSSKLFFPFIKSNFELDHKSCVTYSKPNEKLNDLLSDMESSGFFESSSKFSSKELIHSLKIISDNESNRIDFNNDQQIYKLIEKKLKNIDQFKNEVVKIWEEYYEENQKLEKIIKSLIEKLKPTFYQKHELSKSIKLYYSKYQKFDHNILDYSKDAKYNIKLILEKISS